MDHDVPFEEAARDLARAVSVHVSPGLARVVLCGELDITIAAALRARLRELLVTGHTDVVVDLAHVTFMDSSALGVLVSGQRQARMFRGSFVLANPSVPVRRLLSLTSLDRVFEVRRDHRDRG